ncbi:type II toxin-antitoxin system RelE family toxin [Pseudomonas citronellolis]|uniref:type II toxin-antitoxin system RelE family toxin n=1 Tax=Pseudomonas citronellolis TaxID=53408 RepID=UPI0007186C9F|nr:type II toxin-antitoxin system RelE/ParE family toxin [Pseudomonas citronellolis]KRV69884.1 cytotoxic translational repressor of toxin-antitoxin stability system [Pseudomonas citronellolis]KRW77866.1 cytotoxic translational repressor of toxin-antitoxin stability system [Pseudomonas citronellolis]WRT81556.1 type II toxin-antitoxin system RelE/ParE family toxin [Pseudomonas citronellolis]
MNSVNWSRKAVKQLLRLDGRHQAQVRDAVGELSRMPDCRHVKALNNHTYGYRLRVGNYRVLFDWDGEIRIVAVQEVKKRDERTY